MRSMKLVGGIKTGSVAALVPALGLASGVVSGIIIAVSGGAALTLGYICRRFFRSPAAAVALAGFIAGLLWTLGFAPGGEQSALAYLAAFALCAGGAASRIPVSEEVYDFTTVLGAACGFMIVCLFLAALREIVSLSAGQSLFAAGFIFSLIKGTLDSVWGRKI